MPSSPSYTRKRVKSLQRRQVHTYFEKLANAASTFPKLTAIEWVDGKQPKLTFAEWHRLTLCTAWVLRGGGGAAANKLGAHLASKPLLPGQMVSFALNSSPELYALLTGVSKMGGVACPLDPNDSVETLANVVKNFVPELLIVEDAISEQLRRDVGTSTTVFSTSDFSRALAAVTAEQLQEEFTDERPHMYLPTDTAMVTLTSGTTGVPKGVQITSRALRSLDDIPFGNSGSPLIYAGSVTWVSLHLTLVKTLQGSTLLLMPRYERNLFFDTLVQRKVSCVFVWPMMLVDLLDLEADLVAQLQSTIKQLIYGGAKTPPSVIVAAQRLLPDTDFLQGYGQSEVLGTSMLSPADHKLALQPDPLPKAVLDRLGSAGKPTETCAVKIVGPDLQEALPQGETGMILARSLAAFTGYWRNEEKSRAALTDDGWVVTGDYGYFDAEGYIHIEGRGSETIVLTTGANIYPHEIEATLTELPGVREIGVANVRVRLSKRLGSVNEVGVIVVPEDGVSLDSEEVERDVTEALQKRNAAIWADLQEGARIDSHCKPIWVQVRDSALPRNKNGKVLKKQLGRRASSLVAITA